MEERGEGAEGVGPGGLGPGDEGHRHSLGPGELDADGRQDRLARARRPGDHGAAPSADRRLHLGDLVGTSHQWPALEVGAL